MHVQVITCRFDATRGVVDDDPLRTFCRDKVVLAVREHFFLHGDTPHLAFVVTYRLVAPSAPDGSSGRLEPGRRPPRRHPTTQDLRATLHPEQVELFDLLRDWRNARARQDGVPAYAVLTNKELLAVTIERPTSKSTLRRVAC